MSSGVALIQCGDHWENQRRIVALALGLRERGWAPVVMTYSAHAGAIFLRQGIDTSPLACFVRRPGARAGLGALRAGISLREVFTIERRRTPDRFDSVAKRSVRIVDVLRRTDALSRLLDDVQPELVLVWNGLTGVVANALRQLCRRRRLGVMYLERGLFPDSVFVDPKGTGGRSGLAAAAHMPPRLPSPSPRLGTGPRIFVPLQVEHDTNILYDSPVCTMRDFLLRVSRAAPAGATVVVRRHPEESATNLDLPNADNLTYDDTGTVEQQCARADLVVTINSTVGLTALLQGRPVLAIGRAIYTHKGLCTEPSLDDLATALADPATYCAATSEAVAAFERRLLQEHTARPGFVPTVIPTRRPPAGPTARAFNPRGLDPGALARAWDVALEAAQRAAHRKAAVTITPALPLGATLNLTYRRRSEPITEGYLRAGAADLLGVDPERVHISSPPGAGTALIIRAQDQPAPSSSSPTLVVDPYFEPHIAWLSTRPHSG